jgi:hypothetical protein
MTMIYHLQKADKTDEKIVAIKIFVDRICVDVV